MNANKYLRRKIDNELQSGEFIRWVEQPVPRFFTAASIRSILFGIPWTSFAIYWMWVVIGAKVTDLSEGLQHQHLFALLAVLFVLIGFGMLSSPIWVWQAARKTIYLVTDKRAISIQAGWSTKIRSYLPEQLNDVYRQERADGTGDVIIVFQRWKNSAGVQSIKEIVLWRVRSPQELENMLRQLLQDNA